MGEGQRRALIGIHDDLAETLETSLKMKGYAVTCVTSVDAMLEQMGILPDSTPDAEPNNPFAVYLMDVNLGYPGVTSHDEAEKIYRHVEAAVKRDEVKFMAISGNKHAVAGAQGAGIPCFNKLAPEFYEWIRKL